MTAAITVNELKMVKLKALSSHPWNQANIGRVITRIRRELGTKEWETISHALENARANKDLVAWHAAIDPLIEQVRKAEETKRAASLVAAIKKKELEAKKQEEDIEERRANAAKLAVSRANIVVRRRRGNEAQEKNQE